MPKRNENERRIADVFHAVVREEIDRRRGKPDRLSGRKVSLAITPGNPNLVADAAARRKLPTLPVILGYGKALGMGAHELIYRVERRLSEEAVYGDD